MTSDVLVWLVPITGLLAVLFSAYMANDVLRRGTGTQAMQDIAATIFEGAMAFLRRQYQTIFLISIPVGIGVGVIVGIFDRDVQIGILTSVAFFVGALCSAVAGFIGMFVAVRANVRTAAAAQTSLKQATLVALRGGAVSGFLVVAMSMLGVAGIFWGYSLIYGVERAPFVIVGFAFGASFVALFAQLGGGIYTKAADVGADLVGKVEAGIPEDDPRNAGVIADLVGDNVGDCAGRGADLFESMSAEVIATMILGVAVAVAFQAAGQPQMALAWIILPLVLQGFGIIATIIGTIAAPAFAKERGQGDPFRPLNIGFLIVTLLGLVGLFLGTFLLLGSTWYWFFLCGIVGLGVSLAFVYITQYYTSGSWRPVKEIAEASKTGPGTNVIIGSAVGFETTAATALTVGTGLVAAFLLGSQASAQLAQEGVIVSTLVTGIFGTAVATLGMLMSAAYILAMDTFGPITDNAGGINEMAGAPPAAREVTDELDAVGNTTKALTKGYAVGSAALAAFLLFSAFFDKVKEIKLIQQLGGAKPDNAQLFEALNTPLPIDIARIEVFVGALLGAMLVFLFSSLAIRAVGSAAGSIIEEVRRQFRENPGIMTGEVRPDYGRAVDITTKAALRQMIAPGVLAVGLPVAVGLVFRFLLGGDAGWLSVAGFLIVGTITGVLMATYLNNSGGAWDNAKKWIEAGNLKDAEGNVLKKGSPAHAAAVVGDTVGDPFKDTAGPALHVLVKLLATTALVLAPLFIT